MRVADSFTHFRSLTIDDEPFLWEMLYQALYVPRDAPPFPPSIVERPEIKRYVAGWGRRGDEGMIAIDLSNEAACGAVWIRLFGSDDAGYGYLDDKTPELSIALLPEWRGHGIGTTLLDRFLKSLDDRYKAISLSVSSENPAVRLYRRFGFEVLDSHSGSFVMLRRLNPGDAS